MDAASSQPTGYNSVQKILHWIVVALLIGQYTAGWTMPDITSIDTVEGAWLWHLALGPTILFFAVVRLAWRIAHPVALPADLPAWQRIAARISHDALYALLIVAPILGWAMASSQGMAVKLFGFITLPEIAPRLAPWADTAGELHETLVAVMLGLIAVHVGAALYHYFIRHDRVLQRMLP